MKVFIMYDRAGTIRGTAASAVEGIGVGAHPELSVLEEELNIDPSDLKQHLVKIHTESKVDVKSNPPRRIPKE